MARRILILALLAVLTASAPAWTQDQPAPYDANLQRLAEILGALHYLHGDIAKDIAHWIEMLRADPHNRYVLWLLEKVSNVDERRLRQLSVGTFFYSALFLLEGTGLALAKRWAEYLTIITTASLMPTASKIWAPQ